MQFRIRSTAQKASAMQTTDCPRHRSVIVRRNLLEVVVGERISSCCHELPKRFCIMVAGIPRQVLQFSVAQILTAGIVAVAFAASASQCPADQLKELAEKAGIRIMADGDSSESSENQARAGIPLSSMTQANRQRAQAIIRDRSQYRRLPSLQYTIDEPIYRYLIKHPDVAVSTWRVMGISRFEMWQTGPAEFEAQAIDGSEGIADILYQDENQMVFVCQGSYHSPLLPRPMEAAALIWFRTMYTPNVEGTHVVTQKADVFVRFPSSSVSAIAKVLTPVTNSLMDRNLFEVSLYGSMMSRAVRDEPEWVVQVAQQLEGVLPQRKTELIEVARKPRNIRHDGKISRSTMPAADRAMIHSPQLLFLDPPEEVIAASVDTKSQPSGGPGATKVVSLASPDKSSTGPGSNSIPAQPVSGAPKGNLMLIPYSGSSRPAIVTTTPETTATVAKPPVTAATKATPTPATPTASVPPSAANSVAQPKRSDDDFKLQPVVVPPTGPTATGPVGSESSSSGAK